MEKSIILAGFGGQGVLFTGQILAYAALASDMHVTWIPSYGPEMRGGTAHCTVVVSDEPIGSPLVRNPDIVVAMNRPSTEKYEPLVKAGGLLLVNSSLVKRESSRQDIRTIPVPASATVLDHGDERVANMVMLGALMETTGILTISSVEKALYEHLPARYHHLAEANRGALYAGASCISDLVMRMATTPDNPRHLTRIPSPHMADLS